MVTCPSDTTLADCQCFSFWDACDGAWFEGNTCKARNGKKNSKSMAKASCKRGVHAYATSPPNIKTPKKDDGMVTYTCPDGYILTGCTISSFWLNGDGAT